MNKDLLTNRLVREVLARIAAGEYAAGSRLPSERALGDEFHVSRGTIRQTLGILSELGVLRIRHGSGAYVQNLARFGGPASLLPPEMAKVSLDDILVARIAIETAAIQLACRRPSAATREELASLIRRMEDDIDDLPAFLKHDMAFHEAIVRAGGNGPLTTAFEAIRDYHRYFQVFTSRRSGDERTAIGHHRRILAAIEARQPAQAAAAVRRHLDAMRRKNRGK